jgi:hypothetical protein
VAALHTNFLCVLMILCGKRSNTAKATPPKPRTTSSDSENALVVLRGRLRGIATAQADCNEGLSVHDTVDHTGRAIEGKRYSLT